MHVAQIFQHFLRSNKVEKALRLELEMSKVVDKVLDFSNKEQKSCRTKRTTLACAYCAVKEGGWDALSKKAGTLLPYASLCRSLALLLLRCTHSNFTSVHKGPVRHNLSGDNLFDPFKLQLMRIKDTKDTNHFWQNLVFMLNSKPPFIISWLKGKVVGKP